MRATRAPLILAAIDAKIGRFVSVDPVFDVSSPRQGVPIRVIIEPGGEGIITGFPLP